MTWIKVSRNENYSINENGEVRNDASGKIKRPHLNKANGYLYVDLYKGNKRIKAPIHRLMAEAFIPNDTDKPCVDHKDGNRTNNAIGNLRWASYSDNNSRFSTLGARSERIKVTHFEEVRRERGGGHVSWGVPDYVMHFEKTADAASHFCCTQGNLTLMLKSGNIGRRGKMRGFLFEYEDKDRNV